MMHLMIASMIAANVYKIDSTKLTDEVREKGYIPAPVLDTPGPGEAMYEHLPYSPVIICTDVNDFKNGQTNIICEKHTRAWLKI